LRTYNELIFEGAQGLLLDQTYGWFPHVTRSNTGVKNVINLAEKIGLDVLDIYYLTRSYITRHGAGPLPHELPQQPYSKIVDKTNKPHPYQGTLRFARFDVDLFQDTVRRDLTSQVTRLKLIPHVGMSCLDQIDHQAGYMTAGVYAQCSPEALVEKTRRAIGAVTALGSYGPTRQTVQEMSGKAILSCDRQYSTLQAFDIAQGDALAVV
jgi:adenylosuccinate synthase